MYSESTEGVLCDFWYETQHADPLRLDICDCKSNNGAYCESWICVTSYGYDLTASANDSKSKNEAFLEMVLMQNGVEIRGVGPCGEFDDAELDERILVQNGVEIRDGRTIGRWCYEYNDFSSCFCLEGDGAVCSKWKCHRFLNNAKNELSIQSDIDNADGNGDGEDGEGQFTGNRSEAELFALSTQVSNERYECLSSHFVEGGNLESAHCTQWSGDIEYFGGDIGDNRGGGGGASSFELMDCDGYPSAKSPWATMPSDRWTFDEEVSADGVVEQWNVTEGDLRRSFPYKWQCHSVGMEYRDNEQFMHFYLSTLLWAAAVGLGLLTLIFCWMQYRYITLSSFFCVQGWFFFIFGSIAAVHGGIASLSVYMALQTLILFYVVYLKCKNRGKVPYGSLNQKYDFDPMEESVSRRSDDDML